MKTEKPIIKKVTAMGNGSAIYVPKHYLGRKAIVLIMPRLERVQVKNASIEIPLTRKQIACLDESIE